MDRPLPRGAHRLRRLDTANPGFPGTFRALLDEARDTTARVDGVVAAIIAAVRDRGDAALCDYTRQFDAFDITPTGFRVTADEITQATASIEPELAAALDLAAVRIEAFHRAQMPADLVMRDDAGLGLGLRWGALDAVGIYVPGGKAAYPSSVLMNALPARVAGVPRVAMCVPCPGGALNPLVLAAAHRAGVAEVYRVGGAQAVAAMAYGVEGLARVDKIVGPGNLFVALAKEYVFGDVSIDSIAGPSEIVIVADEAGHPEFIAADMLAQAEHSPGSAILLTASRGVADAVAAALERRVAVLERGDLTRDSLGRFCGIVVTRSDEESVDLAHELAPEHLSIDTRDPEAALARIRHVGAAFLGPYSPVAAGDYAAGPSHVLPTGGTARFAAGLSANEFLRGGSVTTLAKDDLAEMAADIRLLADTEGLTAHRRSVEARLEGS